MNFFLDFSRIFSRRGLRNLSAKTEKKKKKYCGDILTHIELLQLFFIFSSADAENGIRGFLHALDFRVSFSSLSLVLLLFRLSFGPPSSLHSRKYNSG